MAGLIAALFGGRERPPDPNPLPGIGGTAYPEGPAGQTGYPGSTSATRTYPRGSSPRCAKLDVDQLGGANVALSDKVITRQAAYRGDVPGARTSSPRTTPTVAVRQDAIRERLQNNSSAEFYGGPELKSGPGHETTGGNPLSAAQGAGGHSVRDTETPPAVREPVIGQDVPGSQNVRNLIAQDYKATPGMPHVYRSAPNPGKPVTDVVVPNRGVFPAGGGNWTYSMLREMPYTGRGNGARGGDLNGQRYYATGQGGEFANGGMGDYGIARERGGKRPVSFNEPAPWSQNFYDTTTDVGTADSPGANGQAPDMVYYSPSSGRASNGTGRS